MSAKRKPTRLEAAKLAEAEGWDACVARLIGPRMIGEGMELRRRDALQLAAAALRAAGQKGLAAEIQSQADT